MNIDLWDLMKRSLNDMLADFINSILSQLKQTTSDIIRSAFFIEEASALSNSTLNAETIRSALGVLYLFTVGLLTLKLCWQGWKVYVLWRDGEAEVSPMSMLLNSLYALGVALIFPILYEIAVDIALDVSSSVSNVFPNTITQGSPEIIDHTYAVLSALYANGSLAQNFACLLLSLVYVVIFIILVFQVLFRGVQMLIYRLGVPLAVVGLVSSDGGIWKSYVQIFFQQLGIVMIQNLCIRLSLTLISSATFGTLVFGIVFLIAAFKTPKILASILQTGGSGGGHVMYTVMIAARAFAGGA